MIHTKLLISIIIYTNWLSEKSYCQCAALHLCSADVTCPACTLRHSLDPRFAAFCVLSFCVFFFFFCFHTLLEECGYCSINSSRKCWLFSVNSAFVHCSRTHKFHFLSIFSLKMGPTVLFTHLKIILLQWFQQ